MQSATLSAPLATPEVTRVRPSPTVNSASDPEARPSEQKPKEEAAPTAEKVQASVQRVNAQLEAEQLSLRFRVDESSGRTIISVINPETDEVIREIPPKELLDIATRLSEGSPRLLSTTT